ncbi:MAG TPA: GlsB/YeaQ/YmgE family stress response membrane protein [Bryobacteraceae bacterium]|nr:GlsB/YeaQ/YmgE family stress response membrane protein [Bryobacteraceae bacterium]
MLLFIILGLIAGFIASRIVDHHGEGILLDILLGIVGAMVGGWVFRLFGAQGVTGFNLWSLIVAVVGAVIVLFVYHAIRRGVAGRRV